MAKYTGYIEQIDLRASKRIAKEKLEFLRDYVNDNEVINYLNYTASIIKSGNGNGERKNQDVVYLEAIDKKDLKSIEMRWIIDGIVQLDKIEQGIVVDIFVYKVNVVKVTNKYKISKATLYRTLGDAYLHLACVLGIEVLKERETNEAI